MSDGISGSRPNGVKSSEYAPLSLQIMDTDVPPCPFTYSYQDSHGVFVQPQSSSNEVDLHDFWNRQQHDIENLQRNELKAHSLPLARIKKIMKSDEDVRMISAEAPVLFSKACEIFILEVTQRAWCHAERNKRRTVQRSDIAAAVSSTDIFDFLVDIVPREGHEHPVDATMINVSGNEGNGIYPVQGAIIDAQVANAFELGHSNQNRLIPQYTQLFDHQ